MQPNNLENEAKITADFEGISMSAVLRRNLGQDGHTIADIQIIKDGNEHLFRSVIGADPDSLELCALEAARKTLSSDYFGCLKILKSTDDTDADPTFIELDPNTQLELTGRNVSLTSLLRDLNKEGYDNINHIFDDMLNEIVADPDLLTAALQDFGSLQQLDLGLVNPETYAITYPDLSIRPVILDPFQEEKLSKLVSNVIAAKVAIVNAAINNKELKTLFLSQMNPIGMEVIEANFFPLPDHVRIRIDSHTNFEVGPSSQIETNGSEPQGDAVTSATLSLLKRTFSRLFLKNGATPEQVENCFRDLRLPLYKVADKIVEVYKKNSVDHLDLPASFNVGFFAWKHPVSRKPLSNISNSESEKSIQFIKHNPFVKDGYAFDPFDIIRFEKLEDSRYHIPVISLANGEEAPLHFIRKLYSNLSFNGPTWTVLKERSPEIYYKFCGIKHDQWNPQGRRIPEWMWMNPLNPCLTDKVLDALITDPVLIRRFNVVELIADDLRRKDPTLSKKSAKYQARNILRECKKFVPMTRCLAHKDQGLFPNDTGVGGLSDDEILSIKKNRSTYVIKLDSLGGYSGNGIFVGQSFPLEEVPTGIINNLNSEEIEIIKLSVLNTINSSRNEYSIEYSDELFKMPLLDFFKFKLSNLSDNPELNDQTLISLSARIETSEGLKLLNKSRDVIWPHLVDFAINKPKSMLQNYMPPQTFNAIRLSYNGQPQAGVSLSIPTAHSVDVNVFAFGTEQSDFHSRGSITSKTNITGGYGARMLVIPHRVAMSMASLFKSLKENNS